MNMFSNRKGNVLPLTNSQVHHEPAELPRNFTPVLKDGEHLKKEYFAVIDPLHLMNSIPSDFERMKGNVKATGVKQSFDIFDSHEKAATWAQTQNKDLVILRIAPSSTVTPQLPVVEPIQPRTAA